MYVDVGFLLPYFATQLLPSWYPYSEQNHWAFLCELERHFHASTALQQLGSWRSTVSWQQYVPKVQWPEDPVPFASDLASIRKATDRKTIELAFLRKSSSQRDKKLVRRSWVWKRAKLTWFWFEMFWDYLKSNEAVYPPHISSNRSERDFKQRLAAQWTFEATTQGSQLWVSAVQCSGYTFADRCLADLGAETCHDDAFESCVQNGFWSLCQSRYESGMRLSRFL